MPAARPQSAPRHRDFEDSDFHEHKRYPQSRKKSRLREVFD
jgi:Zn-finger nucleic acid-binding protein